MSEIITIQESARLVELEAVVSKGIQSFIEVGEALCEIRDSRLYRIEYSSFEDYIVDKWKMSLPRAKQLIGAAKVSANLEAATIVARPKTESQARPLTKLPAEQQPVAWERAVEKAGGEQPTARQVEEAVVEVLEPEPRRDDRIPDIRSHGLRYSMLAIEQLKKIHPKDTQREAAFAEVVKWINENK
jgi:hypothetical protein